MRVIPVASDSLGVRSMATVVVTENLSLFIDPGVALSPSRFNLPPHPLELERKEAKWQEITNWVRGCEVVVVTHYHYDHHNPEAPEIYEGKVVLLKDPVNNINESQKKRGDYFLAKIKERAREIKIADGEEFLLKGTRIKFSPALRHGLSRHLGFVTAVLIDDGDKKFLFTSDVQGPVLEEPVKFILENEPDIVFCDGPMTYMLNYRYSPEDLRVAIKNIRMILDKKPETIFIIDHHLTRDENYREHIQDLLSRNKVLSAAEYIGEEEKLLEARRRELFKTCPQSDLRSLRSRPREPKNPSCLNSKS